MYCTRNTLTTPVCTVQGVSPPHQCVLYEECPHHTSVYCTRSVPTTPVCTVRGVSPPHQCVLYEECPHHTSVYCTPTHSTSQCMGTLVWGHTYTIASTDIFHTGDRLLTHYQMYKTNTVSVLFGCCRLQEGRFYNCQYRHSSQHHGKYIVLRCQ